MGNLSITDRKIYVACDKIYTHLYLIPQPWSLVGEVLPDSKAPIYHATCISRYPQSICSCGLIAIKWELINE